MFTEDDERLIEHTHERFPFISKDEARELLRRGGAPKDIVEAHQAKVALDNEPAAPKSFATYVLLKGEKPACNALRFATYHEAEGYGNELLSRWLVPTGFEVRETSDPVNYRFDFELYSAVRLALALAGCGGGSVPSTGSSYCVKNPSGVSHCTHTTRPAAWLKH